MAESNQIIQTLRESGQQRHPMHSSLFRATKFISVAGAIKFIRAAEAIKCITLFRDSASRQSRRYAYVEFREEPNSRPCKPAPPDSVLPSPTRPASQ